MVAPMDNNNFGQQPTPQDQPYPGQQPTPQGQPYPNQYPPQYQNPYQGQPYSQPYGQPYGQQPFNQPVPKPPKQPMDPAKKKKIILIISICSAVLVLGIAAAIVIPILLRVDYSTAYSAAKELKPKIYEIYRSYDCEYVIDYVDSSYTSTKKYAEYIENCKKVYSSETDELVSKLGSTDGVQKNNDIKTQFDKFNAEYAQLSSGSSADLDAKLNLWQARHNFIVAADDLTTSSADSLYTTAANYLINSGNDTLKTYGESWLERKLAINAAYRAWQNASYSNPNYNQLREDYNNKRSELSDWVATNKPDLKTIAPLNFDDTTKMYNEFSTLYDLITDTYEKNYNSGSGDCTEFLGEVYCE